MATTSQLAPRQVAVPVAEGPVVLADDLTKRFGDLLAVDDLSFALDRGTVTGFLGPNGAGKTTTLRMLLHLVQPSGGSALVFGRRYQDLERPAARVGAVLEAADFHPGRSGRDHLFSLALALGREADSGHWFLGRSEPQRGESTPCSNWSTSPAPVAVASVAIARNAAAARPRRRTARRPGFADPRRARQRA